MVGFIGFTLAAIIVGLFALSFYRTFQAFPERQRQLFSGAFLLLASALFVWGFAPLLNIESLVNPLVFAGDALLVVGTCFLISAQSRTPHLWLTIILALAGTALVTARVYVAAPTASVSGGLLHFELEGAARYAVLALLAFIWMPFGARITQAAVKSRGLPQFSGIIAFVYAVSLICAAVFVGARQNSMIVMTFVALCLTFLILAFLPLLIDRYQRKTGGESGR